MQRRTALRALSSFVPFAGVAGSALLAPGSNAMAADYRALVVVFLNGGNDGSNCLVPTDAAYTDYERARTNLALPRASLVQLAGESAGHRFGIHPALGPLAPLYDQGRLAWIANAGPLIVPASAGQVLDRAVPVPPFLLSHFEQVAITQGWGANEDLSGWGGRGLESLPAVLHHPMAAVSMNTSRTLVRGRQSAVTWVGEDEGMQRYWGNADFARPSSLGTQSTMRLARGQFANAYTQEYARTLERAFADTTTLTAAFAAGTVPTADFGGSSLAIYLRTLAQLLPVFRQMGLRRQIFLVNWGSFDTHGVQRGSEMRTQDYQLALVGKALAGFDAANIASGVDADVATLVMSEFGRTIRPASGGGSDHAWGNHWWLLGGPVRGGQVVGTFPSPVLGGPDDMDRGRGGRFVPTIATVQVAATLLGWLGVPPSSLDVVLPELANFAQKSLPLMRA